jgi:hypothetical protein
MKLVPSQALSHASWLCKECHGIKNKIRFSYHTHYQSDGSFLCLSQVVAREGLGLCFLYVQKRYGVQSQAWIRLMWTLCASARFVVRGRQWRAGAWALENTRRSPYTGVECSSNLTRYSAKIRFSILLLIRTKDSFQWSLPKLCMYILACHEFYMLIMFCENCNSRSFSSCSFL